MSLVAFVVFNDLSVRIVIIETENFGFGIGDASFEHGDVEEDGLEVGVAKIADD